LSLTPVEIEWKIEAHNAADENQLSHEWFLAKLIGIAFNNPKDYPKLSEVLPSKPKPSQEKTNWNARRREAAKYGLRIPR
jgi:hypothetical protein